MLQKLQRKLIIYFVKFYRSKDAWLSFSDSLLRYFEWSIVIGTFMGALSVLQYNDLLQGVIIAILLLPLVIRVWFDSANFASRLIELFTGKSDICPVCVGFKCSRLFFWSHLVIFLISFNIILWLISEFASAVSEIVLGIF